MRLSPFAFRKKGGWLQMILRRLNALAKIYLEEFDIKSLGRLKYLLGIEVAYSKEGVFLSQHKYILDLLQETGKLDLGEGKDSNQVDKSSYQQLIGRLRYLNHTCPDINLQEIHLQATYQVLAYLKTITRQDILFKKGGKQSIEIYTDVDYARSVIDRRSTSGYCTFDCRNLVTWRSKKQQVVA
ncbi:unnamed protein product [Spirodela intermedia]|uniref:Uncharacterized protein n=1 Tax=Spirodela intermedia TaxID=51605 RepID=A0A7I8KSG0_SPIIN|nr:unnamed protein product [Spirodela intermedia]